MTVVNTLMKLHDVTNERAEQVGLEPLPTGGFKSARLYYWYCARVSFDSPRLDPNGLAKQALLNYERDNHSKLFFKNGHARKALDTKLLEQIVKPFIQGMTTTY